MNDDSLSTSEQSTSERQQGEALSQLLRSFDEGTLADAANQAIYLETGSAPNKQGGLFEFIPCFHGYDQQFDYLIKGYMPARALGVLYGASGSYKSFHALSWATHVALGRNWNKAKVSQAQVLYIAGEGGIGVPRRIKALADHYNDGNPIPNLFRLDHPVHFGDTAQVVQLIHSVKQKASQIGRPFGLIVLDTLARCFNGDENKAEEMGKFISACDRLKAETGATVLIVHHSGVMDPNRARGSSALRAAADFEYRAERVKGESPGVVVIGTKSKDEKEAPSQVFWLLEQALFKDSDGDQIVSLVCTDKGESPPDSDTEKSGTKALTTYEQSLYQAVRCRMEAGAPTGIALLRDDMRGQYGEKARKSFKRWLDGCIAKEVLQIDGEILATTSPAQKIGQKIVEEFEATAKVKGE